eukprot:gene5139-8745_t
MKNFNFILIIILLSFFTIVNSRAALGIDFGSEYIKVAVVKIGSPIDLILNEASKRKSENMVGLLGKDRFFASHAKTKYQRYPTSMFMLLNTLNGVKFKEAKDEFNRFKSLYIPTQFLENSRGLIDVKVGDSNDIYTTEELLAMILTYVRSIAKNSVGFDVVDCVITYPPFYTKEQRQALLDASNIVGFKSTLLSETTAVSIQYGLQKLRDIKSPYNSLFFDFGSSSLKVTVARYRPSKDQDKLGSVNIRAVAYEKTIGGKDFESVLATHFAKGFEKQYGIDITKIPRAMAKLMLSCIKVKEVLSANTETFINVESLHDDIDFRMKITRKEFEELSFKILSKIIPTVEIAIKDSNIKLDKIHSFELIGGSSRIPGVQSLLKKHFKRELQYSLNADECMALGSAFRAAELTPTFRVKKFDVQEPSPILSHFQLSGSDKKYILFKKSDNIGSIKTVTIPRNEDFSITLDDNGEDFVKYSINNVTNTLNELKETIEEEEEGEGKKKEKLESSKKRIVLSFKLTNNGFIELETSSAVLEEKFKVLDSKKKEKIETRKKSLKLNSSEDLINYIGLKKEDVEKSVLKFEEFKKYEEKKRSIEKSRNDLESHLYHLKNKFQEDEELKKFYTNEEKETLFKLVTEYADWLEIQEEETKLNEYIDRFNKLKSLSDPIFNRFDEFGKRKLKIESCQATIKRMKDFVALMEQSFKHITKEERDNLLNLTSETEKFINQKIELQNKTPLNETPIITSQELETKCNALIEASAILMRKPVPPPEPKPEETKVESKEEAENKTEEKKPEPKREDKKEEL